MIVESASQEEAESEPSTPAPVTPSVSETAATLAEEEEGERGNGDGSCSVTSVKVAASLKRPLLLLPLSFCPCLETPVGSESAHEGWEKKGGRLSGPGS